VDVTLHAAKTCGNVFNHVSWSALKTNVSMLAKVCYITILMISYALQIVFFFF